MQLEFWIQLYKKTIYIKIDVPFLYTHGQDQLGYIILASTINFINYKIMNSMNRNKSDSIIQKLPQIPIISISDMGKPLHTTSGPRPCS